MAKDTQHRLRALERQAENVEQQNRELCVVLHNVPETSETEEEDDAAVAALVLETHGDASEMFVVINRLGTCCSDRNKHRPVVVRFETMDEKHIFLKHAKQLKPVGINWDDYLTRQQQKERQPLTADFPNSARKGLQTLLSRLSTEVPCCRQYQELQTRTCSQGYHSLD
ncbi:TPA: hypothetical protein ACH3X1_011715 [Trebouxia sp. C0004]